MNELSKLCYRAYAIHGKQAVYDELAKQKKLRQKDVKNVVYSFCPECNSEEPHLFGECLICGECHQAPKYNIGDKVYYIPKLSGFDNSKPLTVKYRHFQTKDELFEAINMPFPPAWYYSFEGMCLNSRESDLIDQQPKK